MQDPRIASAVIRAAEIAGLGVVVIVPGDAGESSVFVSERAAEIMGYPPADAGGSGSVELRRHVSRLHEDWLERSRSQNKWEAVLEQRAGTRVPVEIAFSSLDLDGRTAAVTFISELSKRHRTEAELEQSEARFRELIETAPDGVGIIQDGRFVYANARAAAIFGFDSVKDLTERTLDQLFEAGDVALMGQRIRKMLTDGTRFPPYVYTCIRGNGGRVRVEVTSIPTRHAGRPAVLGFARDVTDRTRMEAQLAQADRLIALGTLAAGVAHEINNPLTFFYLRLDALERWLDRLPAELRQEAVAQLVELRGGADRVTRIVRDLRTFSRSADQPRAAVDLREVFAFVERITVSEHKHRAALSIDCENVPAVRGESGRLEQVFLNLVLNALQAMPEGGPGDKTVLVRARPDGDGVLVEVADNGPGMPPEVAERVFDPFFTTKPVGIGTGLGLSICHGIISQLGGEISVESSPGVGTTFRVRLPASAPGESQADARRRVLILEDDAEEAASLCAMLSERYDVIAVGDRAAAETALTDGAAVDVILCDLMREDLASVELYQCIAAERPELCRRFVFLTGGVLTERAARFLAEVSSPRVVKPFSASTLSHALEEAQR
ncbi:MAG: PAS domain S-box protein [Myxococcales bacterium]|nr:PAS domain S-box protein [Myxococcales bacterium]